MPRSKRAFFFMTSLRTTYPIFTERPLPWVIQLLVRELLVSG